MKKALCTALALILIFTCLLTACGGKDTSSDKSKSPAKTNTEETAPADPLALTKKDFSYGGRTVNGYTNYIDCIEKSGRTRSYWFTDESSYYEKANRGLNIGDALSSSKSEESGNRYYDDQPVEIFNQYGTADVQDTGENEYYQLFHPEIGSPENDDANLFITDLQKKVVYTLSYHGRTFYKTFYYYVDHHSLRPYLEGVTYSIK